MLGAVFEVTHTPGAGFPKLIETPVGTESTQPGQSIYFLDTTLVICVIHRFFGRAGAVANSEIRRISKVRTPEVTPTNLATGEIELSQTCSVRPDVAQTLLSAAPRLWTPDVMEYR